MPCKKIIVVTIYDLGTDDLWDVWQSLVLEHSLNVLPAFRKASSSQRYCLFVIVLQLGESQINGTDANLVRALCTQFSSKLVPKLT